MTSLKNQVLCAWSGIAFLLFFFLGFCLLAHFIPPPSPNLPAADVAAIYQGNLWLIRLGMAFMLLGAGFIAPWAGVITLQMRRIEGARALAYGQLLAGGAPIMLFTMCGTIWATAAFRPERNPDLVLLLHDLAWITLLTPIGAFIVQYICIALAILQDKSSSPVFPRWSAFYNLWTAVMFVPGVCGFIFKTGPFAWDGLFVFWIPVALFGAWYIVMLVLLLKAIGKQAETERLGSRTR